MTKAYVVPFVLYVLGTSFIARFGDAWYPALYAAVVALVAAALGGLLWQQRIIRPHLRVWPAIGVGLLGIGLWIGLCELQLEQQLGVYLPTWLQPAPRVSYNPLAELSPWGIALFLSVRIVGIAFIVPLAEELFWRGFLLRWLIDPDWEKVPIGEYTLSSCLLVTLFFTLAHPEWLAAAVYSLLLNALLYWKRDLWLCIVAHGVSNLALVGYVLASGAWWLW